MQEAADDVVDRFRRKWGGGPIVTPMETFDAFRGHIIGSVELHAASTPDSPPDSPWYVPGSLALNVREAIPLRHPVPAKGGLGLWRPTAAELAACREAA